MEGEDVGEGEVRLDVLASFLAGLQATLRRLALLRAGKRPVGGRLAEPLREALDLRLVGFGKGSATLLVRPGAEDAWGDPATDLLAHLGRRMAEPAHEWDRDTADALEQARKSLGKGGRFSVQGRGVQVSVDEKAVSRLRERAKHDDPQAWQTVTGWLHMADLQPNEVIVKTPLGIEWRCRFDPEMKQRIIQLLDQVVVAAGPGTRADRRGEMVIEEIRPSLPEAYQLTIAGDVEAVLDERLRTMPRRQQAARRVEGPRITERDVQDLMKAIEELDRSS